MNEIHVGTSAFAAAGWQLSSTGSNVFLESLSDSVVGH
jgi:hypothetical protein